MHLCKIRYREISGVHTENKEESNMIRRVIQIEEDKCNGCGACAKACHEGAIGMVNGKAKLMRDDYCDGLGDCLPACPMDAIHFIEREAEAYDEAAVLKNKEEKAKAERSRLRQCRYRSNYCRCMHLFMRERTC